MPPVVGRLGFKLPVQVICLLCILALSESMPPRTLVHCPGCPRTYASESALRKHRGHRCSVGTPCYLDIHQPARVSRWVAGAGVGPGRLQITEMDMFGVRSRSPSPDPGDDEGPPPPGFDEDHDDLGPPPPPPPPAFVSAVGSNLNFMPRTPILTNTHQYTLIHTDTVQSIQSYPLILTKYMFIHTNTYNTDQYRPICRQKDEACTIVSTRMGSAAI